MATSTLFSEYYNKLESAEVKQRYREKIAEIDGIDPYTIKKSEWVADLGKLPQITWPDLVMYLVFGVNEFTINKDSFKSLEAYNQFVCGWVRDIVLKEFPHKSLCLLSCRVMHSQRLSAKPLQPWIIAEKGGTIKSAHCDCMAGLGETCTHVAALLFATEYHGRQQEKTTVTQEKAYWMVPSIRKAPYAEAADIDFTSAKTKKKNLDAGTPNSSHQARSTRTAPPTSTTELHNFYTKLHDSGIKPAILSLIDPYAEEYRPKVASHKYPKTLSFLNEPKLYGKPFKEVKEHCSKLDKISVTPEQVREVEADTRDQAGTKLWFDQRAGRITASKMKNVCHTDPRMPSQSLVQSICYPDLYRFSSAATSWGCQHEKLARDEYADYMVGVEKHSNFQVSDAGLTISLQHPYIGASPDGFVSCTCCGAGCIEVKCPHCAKDASVSELASSKTSFCLTKSDDGTLKLKTDHAYYYQVQTQMHVTNTEYCDFVLWTPDQLHCERVYPDVEFWQRTVQMAAQFFNMCLMPELVARFYSRNRTAADNQVERLPEGYACYCSSELEVDMLLCADESCTYIFFIWNAWDTETLFLQTLIGNGRIGYVLTVQQGEVPMSEDRNFA